MSDIFNSYVGEWVFIKSGNDKYIGRYTGGVDIAESIKNKTMVLQPAFYYHCEYVQDQAGNVSRQLAIIPVELCVGFESTVIVSDVCFVMKFDDMSSEDRYQFEKSVTQGVDSMIEAKAARSGITLERSMPGGQSDPGSIIFG